MPAAPEDAAIAHLRAHMRNGGASDAGSAAYALVRDEHAMLARKAWWAYRYACRRLGRRTGMGEATFRRAHREAWQAFLSAAARASSPGGHPRDVPGGNAGHTLTVGWHFPEYPRELMPAARAGALLLVAQETDWLRAAIPSASLLCFRRHNAVMPLVRAFREGRAVCAMMDYCYDETAAAVAPFLGSPARTPAGVMRLAARFEYDVRLTSGGNTRPLIDAKSLAVMKDDEACAIVNAAIEAEILRSPPSWLLWASVDRRWLGVDYT